jgi:hypothetical protein
MTAFVPNGDNRRDTATILLGTAQEHGLDDSREVVAVQGGFYISDKLADVLYDEGVSEEPEPKPESKPKAKAKKRTTTTKTSGNRAAKNDSEEE